MGLCGNDQPDPAKGYVAGINADLETLPARRIIEALATLGQSGYVNIPGKGGGEQFFDFTGLGDADYAREYGDDLTAQLLAIQREMGPQYVEQRLAELEASDPEGAAMRRRLWDNIKTGVEAGPTSRPGNEEMQRLILERLDRAGTLDPETEAEISQQVLGKQTATGNYLGNAAATEEARVLTSASDAQRAAAQQQALAFLTGGLSPDDVAYREGQQNLSNLGAFIAGETPVAQFGQLSGAQAGAAPFTTNGPLPGVNPAAGWQGVNNSMGTWSANQQLNNSQVNPWLAGVAGGAQGLNLWAAWNGGGAARPAQGPTGEFEW